MGSYGRRIGKLYGGIDDISVFIPQFETNLCVTSAMMRKVQSGDFETASIDSSRLIKDYYSSDPYHVYISGERDAYIYNAYGNGKKCFVIGDSFAATFVPFIALDFSETLRYDARSVEGTAVEHINEFQPDVVIVIYNSGNELNEMFDFGT